MSPSYQNYDDHDLVQLLRIDDVKAFELLYDRYVDILYEYVDKRIDDREQSKEIVQELFEWLWKNRTSIVITSSVRSYLLGSAKHQILNYIRSKQIQHKYVNHFIYVSKGGNSCPTEEMINLSDLETGIDQKISELPDKCRTVFRMSRIEHQSIQHIAKHMNISRRTVENYISRALKHLRASLGDFPVAIFVLLFKIFPG